MSSRRSIAQLVEMKSAADVPIARSRVLPDEVEGWLSLTHHDDPKLRSKAVRALCPCHVKRQDDRIWERIFEMASDDDAHVRSTILHALGDGSPRALEPQVVSALEAMRDDPDPSLRRRVRKLLAVYRRTGQVNVL
jgi:HEAT repeat protein